jgi:hypothetical protein
VRRSLFLRTARSLLSAQLDEANSDLMLLENFR